MKKPIIWVHGDCLSPKNPALQTYPDAPAIWVWDDALLEEWQINLKRIVFIYECLLELPVTIRRGDVAQEVVRLGLESLEIKKQRRKEALEGLEQMRQEMYRTHGMSPGDPVAEVRAEREKL